MTAKHIVIVGAGYAGLLCAIRLARQTRRDQARITLVNAGDHFIERIRLHEWLSGGPLAAHPLPRLLQGTGVEFINGRMTSLDLAAKTLHIEHSAATPSKSPLLLDRDAQGEISYDRLVYALGSHTDRWSIPGVAEHSSTLEGPSAEALRTQLPGLADRGGHLAVIGSGLTAIETVTELASAFPALRLTLVTSGVLGSDLSAGGQAHLRATFSRLGIALLEHTRVERLEAGRILSADRREVSFDACLWTAGFVAPPLAREAGLAVNQRGQVQVDSALRALGHDSIQVVGDSAAVDLPWGTLRMGCVSAMPMGAYVADQLAADLAGQPWKPFRFGFQLRCISLGRRDGLVQMVSPDDRPTRQIVTGRAAALVKEGICRYTLGMIRAERYIRRAFFWPQPKAVTPAELPQHYSYR
ncbi:MAG TPA: FAD-dependent oxidoreductase [Aggregatilineales bacterium]|nr:FAD-dependent oxidoreductase [Aggregatilineales bacterium]